MADLDPTIKWRKYRKQSVQALPVALALLIALCITFYVVSLFVSVPTWLAVVAVGIAAFSVIMDVINIVYLGWKLRQAAKKNVAAPSPRRTD